jgi:rhodanese-related sulfurtransferase
VDAIRKRAFKDEIYAAFAGVAQALANGHRLELIDLLAQAERRVEELAHLAGLSVANASQHLQVLRRAKLVRTRRSGTRVYYRLADDGAHELWRALRAFAEAEVPAIERLVHDYLEDRQSLDALGADELRDRLRSGDVMLIDVRPEVEFEHGHIPGAHSMPIDELEARIVELPADREIVAYCRGRYCVYADEAVRLLRRHGLPARRCEVSVQEWNDAAPA